MIILAFEPEKNRRKWRLRNIESLRSDEYGIYGIWYGKRCIYVGKAETQTIRDRLYQHWTKTHNQTLENWIAAEGSQLDFSYLPVEDRDSIDHNERYYIKRFQPVANKQLVS